MSADIQQFVLMPVRGLSARGPTATDSLRNFFFRVESNVAASMRVGRGRWAVKIRVLDSIHEDGAKLVEMPPQSAVELRLEQPGMRLVPVTYFRPAIAPRPAVRSAPRAAATGAALKIKLRVVSGKDGSPIVGAQVIAFTDFANRQGAEATTNSRGEAGLALGSASRKVERLYIYPRVGFWSVLKKNITVTSTTELKVNPVDLSAPDVLRHFYKTSQLGAGAGVKVGVVDSGVDLAHADLQLAGGENTVVGEKPGDFGDNGSGHGTHVAGIVGARGTAPQGMRGIAPGVALYSYRVFGKDNDRASNYSIAKGIDRAVRDGCDLINLSLAGGPPDDLTRAAIEDARSQGSLVIVAAGNDGRQPVSFPASDSLSIAVSALGVKGTFPRGAAEAAEVMSPYGRNRDHFIAAFSNIGVEIDLTGTGVGVVSTFPGGYLPLSGTSMACPAVTGFAAKLLATQPALVAMNREQARSDAIAQMLVGAAKTLGFPAEYEGRGLAW